MHHFKAMSCRSLTPPFEKNRKEKRRRRKGRGKRGGERGKAEALVF